MFHCCCSKSLINTVSTSQSTWIYNSHRSTVWIISNKCSLTHSLFLMPLWSFLFAHLSLENLIYLFCNNYPFSSRSYLNILSFSLFLLLFLVIVFFLPLKVTTYPHISRFSQLNSQSAYGYPLKYLKCPCIPLSLNDETYLISHVSKRLTSHVFICLASHVPIYEHHYNLRFWPSQFLIANFNYHSQKSSLILVLS